MANGEEKPTGERASKDWNGLNNGGTRRKRRHHDVLLIRDQLNGKDGRRLDRFAVDKTTGAFKTKPPEVPPGEAGRRPIMNLGTARTGTRDDPLRGPVLSALPLHPSPAASATTTCYLINEQNLNYTTPWTAEEWNDKNENAEIEGFVGQDRFSVLIASPAGKVYYFEKKGDCAAHGQEIPCAHDEGWFELREVDLHSESEIWGELRNGCVAGSAIYEAKATASRCEKVVPLVNIDSLMPRSPKGTDK